MPARKQVGSGFFKNLAKNALKAAKVIKDQKLISKVGGIIAPNSRLVAGAKAVGLGRGKKRGRGAAKQANKSMAANRKRRNPNQLMY